MKGSGEGMKNLYYSLKDEYMTIACGKAEYVVRHRVDPAIQLDTWLVQRISINGSLVMSGTDIEGPVKQVGAADFIGGIHGDEKYTSVTILVDGTAIDEHSEIPTTPYARIDVFVTSDLFFCDSDRHAFVRQKHLAFEEDRLTIGNVLTYIGKEDFYVQRWPANGIFSLYKDVMNGYTTNTKCSYITDTGTAPDKYLDCVTFFGNQYCVTIKSLAEKYDSYMGFVHDFKNEARPRFKAYFDTLDNANGDVVLTTDQKVYAEYEIHIV